MTRVAAASLLFGGLALGFSSLSFAALDRPGAALVAALGGAAGAGAAIVLLARAGRRDRG